MARKVEKIKKTMRLRKMASKVKSVPKVRKVLMPEPTEDSA